MECMNEKMLILVRKNAHFQSSPECRENYFRSCEKHGGELAEIAVFVRNEFPLDYQI